MLDISIVWSERKIALRDESCIALRNQDISTIMGVFTLCIICAVVVQTTIWECPKSLLAYYPNTTIVTLMQYQLAYECLVDILLAMVSVAHILRSCATLPGAIILDLNPLPFRSKAYLPGRHLKDFVHRFNSYKHYQLRSEQKDDNCKVAKVDLLCTSHAST